MLTPEYLLALGKINPDLEEILKNVPVIEVLHENTDIPAFRATEYLKNKESNDASRSAGNASYVEEDTQILVRDGSSIAVRIHKPKSPPKDGCPIFVVYHGGGFVLGGLEGEAQMCRKFTELGGIAVNVDYRHAPEHPFPTSVLDAYDALKWTAENFEQLGGNPSKGFLVGGMSAGGNISAVITHLYRDDKISPPLTGAYLSIPAVCPPHSVPEKYKHVYLSHEQNKNAPILNRNSTSWFEKHYKPDYESNLRNPLLFESHKGLPPTYFQICGLDPLRDEAFIYEDILREENGVKTRVDVYPGLPHSFWGRWPEAHFSAKREEDSFKAMKWLLEQRN
ncbi:related to Putative sterigmatocystin biosynthesis lipase/esterase STCI [Rhynchosporium graminicola]|uniref:Related to Putative sterigmatocystin biosynthesis lipase/esterase STCI n=1 Tax=Rhynchosporium graminicola TaxID=2792576 RepID=A0A1E1LCC8_9HELO|nr:related to Putative sterigmatocystin biosynthesis lipase/esterase STCI [Rhynchosporium commune]